MAPDVSFEKKRSLNDTLVYRNITKPRTLDVFNDLLNPEDDPQDAQLAMDMANSFRCCPKKFLSSDTELVINRVFQRKENYRTRYSNGTFPVWYGCLDTCTTIYETAYHIIRHDLGLGLRDSPKTLKPIVHYRVIYEVACTAILIDLTEEKEQYNRLIHPSSYIITNLIGQRVQRDGHPGLLAPSARLDTGVNVVIFTPKVLSRPFEKKRLTYRLDTQSKILEVSGKEHNFSIDGSRWF